MPQVTTLRANGVMGTVQTFLPKPEAIIAEVVALYCLGAEYQAVQVLEAEYNPTLEQGAEVTGCE